jgi:hypothetical protein
MDKNKTVYDLVKFYELSLIDIVRTIKSEKTAKGSKNEIEQIKSEIKMAQRFNSRANYKIRQLSKTLKNENGKYSDFEILSAMDSIDDINKGKKVTFRKKVKGVDVDTSYQKISIGHLNNSLNRLRGVDSVYYFNDGFNKYSIKKSVIVKMKDNSFFLEKLKNSVEKEIEKIKRIKRKSKNQKRKLDILSRKLLVTVNFNLKLDSLGRKKIGKLTKKETEEIEIAFSNEMEKSEKEGRYIMTAFFNGLDAFEF